MTLTDTTHDLTYEWADAVTVDGKLTAVTREPLLVMLTNSIRASTGATSSGRSDDAARSPLNVHAFELKERITRDVLMATRRHTRDNPNPMLGYAINTLAENVDLLWTQNQITETEYLGLIARAEGWKTSIMALYDPVASLEITAPCPTCETRYVENTDGERQAALTVTHRAGTQAVAHCGACGLTWEGEFALQTLGAMIGTTPATV